MATVGKTGRSVPRWPMTRHNTEIHIVHVGSGYVSLGRPATPLPPRRVQSSHFPPNPCLCLPSHKIKQEWWSRARQTYDNPIKRISQKQHKKFQTFGKQARWSRPNKGYFVTMKVKDLWHTPPIKPFLNFLFYLIAPYFLTTWNMFPNSWAFRGFFSVRFSARKNMDCGQHKGYDTK